MKTIIVPLDFSNKSLGGLNMALMLAKKTGANVQMVHVIRKHVYNNNELLEKENQLVNKKFEEILQKCKSDGNIDCILNYSIKEGKIFSEITNLADKFEDSLVVLSTQSESGFEELFIGGNAYKITSHSKNPVITVRKGRISSNLDKIVLPIDITLQTREKVPYTVKLAKLFNSEIHLITVRDSHLRSIEQKLYKYTEQVCSYFWDHDIPYKVEHLTGGNLTDLILDYSDSVHADLISIMTAQERSVSNLLLGTYAHQMVNKARIPVLSFPAYQLSTIEEDIWTLGAFNA
jgi:nucleotide-binding universal stress UspA family protein